MRVIINNVADTLVILALHHTVLLQVVHLQSAPFTIVGGIDDALMARVERHVGRIVECGAIQVVQFALLACSQVDFGDMSQLAWGIHGCVGLPAHRVVHQRRYRAKRLGCDGRCGRNGILADGSQIGLLVAQFVLLPVVPHLAQRLTVDFFELTAKERATISRTIVKGNQFVVTIVFGEIVHKSRTIQIGVGAHLEVHGRAFGFESHHREEFFAIGNDTAKVHLVVATECAPYASAKPCFHKTGDTLVIPAGGIPARHTQIAPQGRNGLGIIGTHLRTKQTAPMLVAQIVFIGHHGVGVLMLEQLAVTLARRRHIVRHVERCHTNLDDRPWQWRGSAVTIVFPVGQQQQWRF